MRFIDLFHRAHAPGDKTEQRLLLVIVVLGAFLLMQVGVVVWFYLNQWKH